MVKILTSLPAAEWPQMRDFLVRRYRPDLALLWRPLFDWQYQSARRDGGASVITAWDRDRLVGTLGYLSLPMFWGDWREPLIGAWAMNWMVEPEYRTGIGWLLLRKLQDMHPVVFSIDASSDNLKLVASLRWSVEPALPRYIRVIDPARVRTSFDVDIPTAALVTSAAAADALCAFDCHDEGFAPDWPLYMPLLFGTLRSTGFLRWRYLDHPHFHYTVATTGDRRRPAVCAYRVELAFDRDGHPVTRVGRLLDFFHPTDRRGEADAEILVQGVLTRLAHEGCAYADFTGTSASYGDTLRRLGWIEEAPGTQVLPSRLTPIERVPRVLNVEFGVRAPHRVPPLGAAYITRADCDADRPALLTKDMRAAIAPAAAGAVEDAG